MITKLYREDGINELCFNVESSRPLTPEERQKIAWLITRPYARLDVRLAPTKPHCEFVEIGPRPQVETPFSSNAVGICRNIGLDIVARLEESRLYPIWKQLVDPSREELIAMYLDKMTQKVYPEGGITSFEVRDAPSQMRYIPVLTSGADAIRLYNTEMGLGMDEVDIAFCADLFIQKYQRNPTDVELVQLGNMNSEHCRHKLWKGRIVIDGVVMPETLLDLVRAPLRQRGPCNSLLAFNDNAGCLAGPEIWAFVPENPGDPSKMVRVRITQHIIATAETHNHPTAISPYPGAATGVGGEIRDESATGSGSRFGVGHSGYCTANLHLPDFEIPGETLGKGEIPKYASPLQILIQGSNGLSHYANAFGRPLVGGFCRTFDQRSGGERRGFHKPILYSGGVATIDARHVVKGQAQIGMMVLRWGGPGFEIGLGGGAASSLGQGDNTEGLDFKSVQRGNPEMENRANRVINTCTDLGDKNPIVAIHDQGAGGPSNVLTELVEALGALIDSDKITLGDKTMAPLAVWSAEFQEGYGALVRREDLWLFRKICQRERVNCEVMGEITGDYRIKVISSKTNTVLVDLDLRDVLTHAPQKTFEFKRIERKFDPPVIPTGKTVEQLIEMVFRLPSVGSKGFLVRKIDRSVTGRVACQPCCGSTQIPCADVGVYLDGYFGDSGSASALGEQPNVMLVNPQAGARMSGGEMVTNMCAAKISGFPDIKTRINQMGAFKLPGEGARLWDANVALRDMIIAMGGAEPDGGKDSSSMVGLAGGEKVKAPSEMVVLGYAPVPDCNKVLTPDFKYPGQSLIGFIDLGHGKNRLGGSALLQALNQVGDVTPDVDDPDELRRAFDAVQELISKGLISAYHDRSDGGLVATLAEMCLSANCGVDIFLSEESDIISTLFSQELGIVFEYRYSFWHQVTKVLENYNIPWYNLGNTYKKDNKFKINVLDQELVSLDLGTLRPWWEATSTRLELEQANPTTVQQESETHKDPQAISYHLTFVPEATRPEIFDGYRSKVAILREEGTNGEREMQVAFETAGCEVWDVSMQDLLDGKISLDSFQGLVAAGGFSYMDVFESAKGWAAGILFNPKLKEMFDRFYNRKDTFSLGVCNGAQLLPLIRWVPSKNLPEESQPRFVENTSRRFESRWSLVRILPSPSILFTGMEDSVLGVHVDHGEGRMNFPDREIQSDVMEQRLVPMVFVGPDHIQTEQYPYSPNGSPMGFCAMCTPDGRHTAMMPHPERAFLKLQWHYLPESCKRDWQVSPWLRMFQNARKWMAEHRV